MLVDLLVTVRRLVEFEQPCFLVLAGLLVALLHLAGFEQHSFLMLFDRVVTLVAFVQHVLIAHEQAVVLPSIQSEAKLLILDSLYPSFTISLIITWQKRDINKKQG